MDEKNLTQKVALKIVINSLYRRRTMELSSQNRKVFLQNKPQIHFYLIKGR
jgi:hypothetical protein